MQDFEFEIFKANSDRRLNIALQTDDLDLFKSWSSDLQKQFPSGSWRTINGAKVFIDGGKVVAGLNAFNGKIDDFFKQKEAEKQAKEQTESESQISPEANKKIEKIINSIKQRNPENIEETIGYLKKQYLRTVRTEGQDVADNVLNNEVKKIEDLDKKYLEEDVKALRNEYFKKNKYAPSSIKVFISEIKSGEINVDDLPNGKDIAQRLKAQTEPKKENKLQEGLANKTLNKIWRFEDGDESYKRRIDRGQMFETFEKDGKYWGKDDEKHPTSYRQIPKAVHDYFNAKKANDENKAKESLANKAKKEAEEAEQRKVAKERWAEKEKDILANKGNALSNKVAELTERFKGWVEQEPNDLQGVLDAIDREGAMENNSTPYTQAKKQVIDNFLRENRIEENKILAISEILDKAPETDINSMVHNLIKTGGDIDKFNKESDGKPNRAFHDIYSRYRDAGRDIHKKYAEIFGIKDWTDVGHMLDMKIAEAKEKSKPKTETKNELINPERFTEAKLNHFAETSRWSGKGNYKYFAIDETTELTIDKEGKNYVFRVKQGDDPYHKPEIYKKEFTSQAEAKKEAGKVYFSY